MKNFTLIGKENLQHKISIQTNKTKKNRKEEKKIEYKNTVGILCLSIEHNQLFHSILFSRRKPSTQNTVNYGLRLSSDINHL